MPAPAQTYASLWRSSRAPPERRAVGPSPRARNTPDVGHRLEPVLREDFEKVPERSRRVSDGPNGFCHVYMPFPPTLLDDLSINCERTLAPAQIRPFSIQHLTST